MSKLRNLFYNRISAGYRFRNRVEFQSIPYPPNVQGEDDFDKSAKNEDNPVIQRVLHVKPHPEEALFPNEYSTQPPRGRIYEKFPFKFQVEKGKIYSLCTCGYSNTQPFCDRTHKMLWTTHLRKKMPKYRPIKYVATETKDVWFCNCKQSNTLPLCDGTHKTDKVQKENSTK